MPKIVPSLTDSQPRNAKGKYKPYKLAYGNYPEVSLGEARATCTTVANLLIDRGLLLPERSGEQRRGIAMSACPAWEREVVIGSAPGFFQASRS